jgi:hypothetical protein
MINSIIGQPKKTRIKSILRIVFFMQWVKKILKQKKKNYTNGEKKTLTRHINMLKLEIL